MALFSDIDWVVLLAIGGFLFLGKGSGPAIRQFGRYYGRLMRLKQELLADFANAAEIPPSVAGQPVSIRQSFLSWESSVPRGSGIPAAVSTPPLVAVAATAAPLPSSPLGFGPSTWVSSHPSNPDPFGRSP
jgi:hypothetical protein